jgi:uncharacterized repeat protein (TIGR01451 family)
MSAARVSLAFAVLVSAFSFVSTNDVRAQAPAFAIQLTDSRDQAAPGETLLYVLTVKNMGTTVQTTNVEVTASTVTTIQSSTPQATISGESLKWNNQSFQAGEEKTYRFVAKVKDDVALNVSIGTHALVGNSSTLDHTLVTSTSTATASSSRQSSVSSSRISSVSSRSSSRRSSVASSEMGWNGEISSSSSSSVRSTRSRASVIPDPREQAATEYPLLVKSADHTEILPGGRIRYTVTVRNILLHRIEDVVVSDRFDAAFMSMVDEGTAMSTEGQLEWELPSLQPGEDWTASYVLVVHDDVKNGTTLNNIVSVVGGDVSEVPVDERVRLVATSVVTNLPAAGFPADTFSLFLFVPLAAAGAYAMRRR